MTNIPSGLAKIVNSCKPLTKSLFKVTSNDFGDSRQDGFSLICGSSEQPVEYPVKAYFSDGTLAFMLDYYGLWSVTGQPRAYTGWGRAWQVNWVAITALANVKGQDGIRRDGKAYLILVPEYKIARSVILGIRNGSCI